MNVVKGVVEKDRCIGCGVCIGLCPKTALMLCVVDNGDQVPICDESLCNPDCELCMRVCPFRDGVHDSRQLSTELYSGGKDSIFHDDVGWYLHSFVGYRVDEALRQHSASGGLLTWSLEQLLEHKLVDRVAVVRRASSKNEQLFEFFAARSIEELRQSAGSVYHPVSIDGVLREIASDSESRWAVVGVPCMCSALRGVWQLQHRILFVFGIACGMYQNTYYTELLTLHSGISLKQVGDISYRIKLAKKMSNDYTFQVADNNGNTGQYIHYLGLPYFLGKNAFFRQNACNYCTDVFAEAADACFMDAWLPEYLSDNRGTSLIVVRNQMLQHMLEQGRFNEDICVGIIGIDKVVSSQSGHVRRKRHLINMRLGEKINPSFSYEDRLTWFVQRYVQRRSKSAWIAAGREGTRKFWLYISDAIILIMFAQFYCNTLRRTIRIINMFKLKFIKHHI